MKFATLLTISTTAYGLAFDGPLPTPVTDLVYAALTGFSPKPTNEVRALPDLFRRQKNANQAICGFLNGDADFPVSCTSSSSCIFSASQSWFGCCASGNCEVMTRCINSVSLSSCLDDASCYNDPLAMACSASSAPSCINMYAKISEGTMNHWVCGASATSVRVLASATSETVSVTKTGGPKSSDASVIRGGAAQSAGGAAATASLPLGAPSSTASTGKAAIQTASAMVGVAGGLLGVFAVFL